MKEPTNNSKIVLVLCLALVLGGYLSASALKAQTERKATLINIDGVVDVQKAGSGQWIPAEKGMVLGSGDTVRTTLDSVADLLLDDGGALRVAEETQMTIEVLASDTQKARFLYFFNRPVAVQKSKLKLTEGKVIASLKKLPTSQSAFQVETPMGVAGVRGTTWGVETKKASPRVDIVSVQQGSAWVAPKDRPLSGIDALLAPSATFIRDLLGPTEVSGTGTSEDLVKPANAQFVAENTQAEITEREGAFPELVKEPLPESFREQTAEVTRDVAEATADAPAGPVVLDTTPVLVQQLETAMENTVDAITANATDADPTKTVIKDEQTNSNIEADKVISSPS